MPSASPKKKNKNKKRRLIPTQSSRPDAPTEPQQPSDTVKGVHSTTAKHICPSGQPCLEDISASVPPELILSATHPSKARVMNHQEMLSVKLFESKTLDRFAETTGLTWTKGRFTNEESEAIDSYLTGYKQDHGLDDEAFQALVQDLAKHHMSFWTDLAVTVGNNRPLKILRERVRKHCLEKARRGHWTSEEDAKLKKLVPHLGTKYTWAQIAERLGTRTAPDCVNRWKGHLQFPDRRHGRWTAEEEQKLADLVWAAPNTPGAMFSERAGKISWQWVAQKLGRRTPGQCAYKW